MAVRCLLEMTHRFILVHLGLQTNISTGTIPLNMTAKNLSDEPTKKGLSRPNKESTAAEGESTSGFDSSDDEKEELDQSPLQVSWLDLEFVGCEEKLGICALPGCRFKDTWRSLENDLKCLKTEEVVEVFCLCSKGELTKYRVPWLLQEFTTADMTVHHYPFPDGQVPSLQNLLKMLDELHVNLMNGKKTIVHCYGGLGRSCLVAVCLMLIMDESLEPEKAIEIIRELRGHAAIQTVKQFNFISDFRKLHQEYRKDEDESTRRSISR